MEAAAARSNRAFRAEFSIEIATNTPTGCMTAWGEVPVEAVTTGGGLCTFAAGSVGDDEAIADSNHLLKLIERR